MPGHLAVQQRSVFALYLLKLQLDVLYLLAEMLADTKCKLLEVEFREHFF